MALISPDILTAAQGLSLGAAGFCLFVGLLLWSCGWRWHRFWVVFGITTAAGIVGMQAGQATGGHVLVLGILLAFAGGVMALEVAKLLAFAGGGVAAWLAVQLVLPQAHEMWAVFLAGGLFGVLLYRLWTMLATSFLGVVIATHALLILAADQGVATVSWTRVNADALNATIAAFTVMGVVVQALVAREPAAVEEVEEEPRKPVAEPRRSWWRLAA